VVTWEWMTDKCKWYLIIVQGMLSNQTEICNNKGIILYWSMKSEIFQQTNLSNTTRCTY
jgi:hypothetical protein